MELIFKASAAALLSVVAGMLVKKSNPELSTVLGICTVVAILFSAIGISNGFRDMIEAVKKISGSTQTYISPIMKCLGISMVTKISSDICKDSSQSAAAAALELAGTVSALTILMPFIMNLLKIIGGLR